MNMLTRERITTLRILAAGESGTLSCEMTMDAREVQALCSMALAYLDAQEWRPIETAPRDGTWILIGWESSYDVVQHKRNPSSAESWWESDMGTTYTGFSWWKPIQPLPQPPKEKP